MEVLFKTAGIALIAAFAVLLIRKTSPELSLAVSLCLVALVLTVAVTLLEPIVGLWETARSLYGAGDVYLLPVMKCCAIAVVAKITSDICREASENAAASAVELVGVLCAIGAAMPLIRTMLATIGEML